MFALRKWKVRTTVRFRLDAKGGDILLSSFREQLGARACTITRRQSLPTESIGQNYVTTRSKRLELTSSIRFTSSCSLSSRYSFMFPWSIHSEIKHNLCSRSVAPSSGRMFGCRRCFQATASLQNLYVTRRQVNHSSPTKCKEGGGLTLKGSSNFCGTWSRMIFTATFRPLNSLWNIWDACV